jgi:hypothetical protein
MMTYSQWLFVMVDLNVSLSVILGMRLIVFRGFECFLYIALWQVVESSPQGSCESVRYLSVLETLSQ